MDGLEVSTYTLFSIVLVSYGLHRSGGKSAAATIETDAEYELLRAQLLASKRNAKDITVFVSFDTDEMDAFRRLPKRVSDPIISVCMISIDQLIIYRLLLLIRLRVLLDWGPRWAPNR